MKGTRLIFVGLLVVVLCIAAALIIPNLLGGGSRGGSSGGTSAINCVSVTLDVCSRDPKGTITNNCSKTVRYVKVETTGFDSSGTVIDRDPEYIENISPGGNGYFEAILDVEEGQVSRCTVEITDAGY